MSQFSFIPDSSIPDTYHVMVNDRPFKGTRQNIGTVRYRVSGDFIYCDNLRILDSFEWGDVIIAIRALHNNASWQWSGSFANAWKDDIYYLDYLDYLDKQIYYE